ncbi:protein kinase 4-like protein [Colletotrichum tofieldiae]|uniref:Protein kinase 4-like protein n=1 Tax=Colletotrichum tofieldiae TaxID=708197 RepID=A0A166WN15_9PEZI|nr:protein kinase 4-like protein [Colletotrichum tofieldiae]
MAEDNVSKHFCAYVRDYAALQNCFGEDGFHTHREFFPQRALHEFWTREKITSVLCYPEEWIQQNPDFILQHYIVVFSILVLMRRPDQIALFTDWGIDDFQLPLLAIPDVYSGASEEGVLKEFMKLQWKFCPLLFGMNTCYKLNKRKLSPYLILPVLGKTKMDPNADEDDEVVLYSVKLHSDCAPFDNHVVFKQYRKNDPEAAQLYRNEAIMYSLLSKSPFRNIVKCYGSFEQLGQPTIVLEHAPGGNLLSFFEHHSHPQTARDFDLFWRNFFDLLKGLEAIHDITSHHHHTNQSWRLKGTHQDIRPQNILVFGNVSNNPYDATFELADMGCSHIRKSNSQTAENCAADHAGNGMYCAPEAVRDNGNAKGIQNTSDVWSLGGIASEALIWSTLGNQAREQYQKARVEKTCTTQLEGGFHEGAFHDGHNVLSTVKTWHALALQKPSRKVEALSSVILDLMLVSNPKERGDATRTYKELNGIFQGWLNTPHSGVAPKSSSF